MPLPRGREMRLWTPIVAVLLVLHPYHSFSQQPGSGTCSETAGMRIYSHVSFSEESGDLRGFELALSKHGNGEYRALLFIYRGAANQKGIELTGEVNGDGLLTLSGTWIEHLGEYPSRKEITTTHPIRLVASVTAAALQGNLTIDNDSDDLAMQRTRRIWLCRNRPE
jgi:hypothetical protein